MTNPKPLSRAMRRCLNEVVGRAPSPAHTGYGKCPRVSIYTYCKAMRLKYVIAAYGVDKYFLTDLGKAAQKSGAHQ